MPVFDWLLHLVGLGAGPGERRRGPRLGMQRGARVLVVDDSPSVRMELATMLAADGHSVVGAADAEHALAAARSRPPDLVFLDAVMLGTSGFAVLRELRRDERTRATPIVMMSGNPQGTERGYLQRMGADGVIRKPLVRAEVFGAIRNLVRAERVPARPADGSAEMIPVGARQATAAAAARVDGSFGVREVGAGVKAGDVAAPADAPGRVEDVATPLVARRTPTSLIVHAPSRQNPAESPPAAIDDQDA